MHGVLKADPAVAVTRPLETWKHLELDVFTSLYLSNHILFEAPQQANEDRPHDCYERRHLIRDRIPLYLSPDVQGSREPTERLRDEEREGVGDVVQVEILEAGAEEVAPRSAWSRGGHGYQIR